MEEMPETSAQMKELTTSQDGVGRVAKLQPVSHFYIHGGNQTGDFTQIANQSFGPLNENQFRTTATVSFSGSKDIYALCMGTVFLQPQAGDTTKINLVLKPFKQPINGINIKYIVYRGLEKSDFITVDGKITGSETSGSGFVKYLWAQFNKFYNVGNEETAPEFKASFLGYPHTSEELQLQEATHLIDQYFFKVASVDEATSEEDPITAYDLPIIPRGIHLGKATGSIGIDIVLNDGDYIIENDTLPFQLDLEYARRLFSTIDIASETDAFIKKRLKEVATKFVDVAAFYGLHANGTGKLYVDAVETPLTTKEEIALRLQNFHTKNNFYLYIQANRQRSYNFYGNYAHSEENSNDLKVGATEDNLTETVFGTQGWPIHIFSEAQDPATENNTIAFQLTTDNYDGAALFVQIGELASPHEENFVRNTNLLQEFPEDNTVEVDINYTKALQITIPSIGADTIATFSQCIYEGKRVKVVDTNNPNLIIYLKDLDDVFGLIGAKSVFEFNQQEKLPTVVNDKLQVLNFPNGLDGKDIGAVKLKKIKDKISTDQDVFLVRVTYETLMYNINSINNYYSRTNTNDLDSYSKSNVTSNEDGNIYQLNAPYYYDTQLFSANGKTITGLLLKTTYDSTPTKKVLGITDEENQSLIEIINLNNLSNSKIFFREIDTNEENLYNTFSLELVSENEFNELILYRPQDPIDIYSLDNSIFLSNNYSKYLYELNFNENDNLLIYGPWITQE